MSVIAQAPASVSSATRHVRSLDGLRGLAVLLVLVGHGTIYLAPRPQRVALGGLGVQIFFVLSGYLITSLLLRERTLRGEISLRDFYARRALRIWPLYYAVLLLHVFVLPYLGTDLFSGAGRQADTARWPGYQDQFWGYFLFLQNYTVDLGEVRLGLAVFWSLAVEEQFYLVWPLLLIALTSRWVRWEWAIPTFLVAVVLGSLVLRSLTLDGHLGAATSLEWMIHTNVFGLAIGSLLAWWHHRTGVLSRAEPVQQRRLAVVPSLVGWVVLVLVAGRYIPALGEAGYSLPFDTITFARYQALVTAVAAALVIDRLVRRDDHWSVFALRPVRYLGAVSFGAYLLHPLVLSPVARTLNEGDDKAGFWAIGLYIAVTIALAALSYELVEKRILRLRRHFRKV